MWLQRENCLTRTAVIMQKGERVSWIVDLSSFASLNVAFSACSSFLFIVARMLLHLLRRNLTRSTVQHGESCRAPHPRSRDHDSPFLSAHCRTFNFIFHLQRTDVLFSFHQACNCWTKLWELCDTRNEAFYLLLSGSSCHPTF